MTDLDELQELVVKFCKDRDWRQFHNPKDLALSLVLESAELMEHFQWKNPEEIKKHLTEKKSDVSDELADVLYWVLLIASELDIDLSQALKTKMHKNAHKYPVEKAKGRHTKYTDL